MHSWIFEEPNGQSFCFLSPARCLLGGTHYSPNIRPTPDHFCGEKLNKNSQNPEESSDVHCVRRCVPGNADRYFKVLL